MDIDTRESGRKVLAVVRLVEILEIVGSRSLGATICCFLHHDVRTCAPLSDAVAFVKGCHALCEISSTSRSSNWRAYMHARSVRPTIELYVSWLVPVAFRRRRAKRQPTGHRGADGSRHNHAIVRCRLSPVAYRHKRRRRQAADGMRNKRGCRLSPGVGPFGPSHSRGRARHAESSISTLAPQ